MHSHQKKKNDPTIITQIRNIIKYKSKEEVKEFFIQNPLYINLEIKKTAETPLLYAARKRPSLIPLLLELGANPNSQRQDDGRTVLHVLFDQPDEVTKNVSRHECISSFIDHNGNCNLKDKNNRSILKAGLMSEKISSTSMVRLAEQSDDVNATDNDDDTILHLIARLINLKKDNEAYVPRMVKAIKAGVDPTRVNKDNKTFFYYLLKINFLPARVINLLPDAVILNTVSSDGKVFIEKIKSVKDNLDPRVLKCIASQKDSKGRNLLNLFEVDVSNHFQTTFQKKLDADKNISINQIQTLLKETLQENLDYFNKHVALCAGFNITQEELQFRIRKFALVEFIHISSAQHHFSYFYRLALALLEVKDFRSFLFLFQTSTIDVNNEILRDNKDKIFDAIIACPDESLRKQLLEEALNLSTPLGALIRTTRGGLIARDQGGNLSKVVEAYRKYYPSPNFEAKHVEEALSKAKSKSVDRPDKPFLKTVANWFMNNDISQLRSYLELSSTSEGIAYFTHDLPFAEETCPALHYAAQYRPELLSLFLEFGAPVNAKDAHGDTPLHRLLNSRKEKEPKVSFGHRIEPHILTLLKHGADPGATDANGQNVLKKALVGYLISIDTAYEMLRQNINPNETNSFGNNLLHSLFIMPGNDEVNEIKKYTKLFLERGVSASLKNTLGHNPIYFLLQRSSISVDVFATLVKAGGDPNTQNAKGDNILHRLLREKSENESEANKFLKEQLPGLLELGVNPSKTNNQGECALTVYLNNENIDFDICDLLIKHGANKDTKDQNGNNLLHRLLLSKLPIAEVTERLKKYLACYSPNATNNDGENAFQIIMNHAPITYFTTEIISLLVTNGLDLHSKIKHGNTLLHIVSQIKGTVVEKNDLTDLLLRSGANLEKTNDAKLTPFDFLYKRSVNFAAKRYQFLTKPYNNNSKKNIINNIQVAISDAINFLNQNITVLVRLNPYFWTTYEKEVFEKTLQKSIFQEMLKTFRQNNSGNEKVMQLLPQALLSKQLNEAFLMGATQDWFDRNKMDDILKYKKQVTEAIINTQDPQRKKELLEAALDPTTYLGAFMVARRWFRKSDISHQNSNLSKLAQEYRKLFRSKEEYNFALDEVISGRYKLPPTYYIPLPPSEPYPMPETPPPPYKSATAQQPSHVSVTKPVEVEPVTLNMSYLMIGQRLNEQMETQTEKSQSETAKTKLDELRDYVKTRIEPQKDMQKDINGDLIQLEDDSSPTQTPVQAEPLISTQEQVVEEKNVEQTKDQVNVNVRPSELPITPNSIEHSTELMQQLENLPKISELQLAQFSSPSKERKEKEKVHQQPTQVAVLN